MNKYARKIIRVFTFYSEDYISEDEEVDIMKKYTTLFLSFLILITLSCPAPKEERAIGTKSSVEVDPETLEVLRKINLVYAYEVPDLGLREDKNYARTTQDVEPYRHIKPFKEHFLLQLEYTGPGRAIPEPTDVETVKLGFIGPIMSTVSVATGGKSHEEPLGIKMLQGARLAIEEANAKGGYLKRNIPFELVVSNDNGLWGASGNEIIKMAYKDKVWAILGTIDGANSHIAIRVALKAEIPMMNSGDTDPTFIETNIPWVFRCISDDRQQGYLLVDYLYKKLGFKRVGVIRGSNRYGRFGVREIMDGSRRIGNPIVLEMAYDLGIEDFSLQLERLKQENLDAIIHWGDDIDGAKILNQMRTMGMQQPYFACDRCLSNKFIEIAGENAEGVICTSPWNPNRKSKKLTKFRKAFNTRFGEEPETFAAHAYDGMNMLIWAVQVVGLNRAKIRDVLAYRVKPWEGVTGDITLSSVLDDIGDVYLVKRENSQWNFYSREDLKIPRDYILRPDKLSSMSATDRLR
jgi:ABC-type branched-subunit amino acid transport system substrate-binding protein